MLTRLLPLAVLGAIALASPALATDPRAIFYPNGAEGSMIAVLPKPGFYAVNYFEYYNADRFNDSHGDSEIPDFKLTGVADFLRLMYVTPVRVLGAKWAMYVVPSIVHVDVTAFGTSQSTTGAGDLLFSPMALSWDMGQFHWGGSLDIIAPTGKYDPMDLANTGKGAWNFEPFLAATWRTPGGFEASVKGAYDIFANNPSNNYQNGEVLHLDYAVQQHFGPLGVGVGGYFWHQTTDDMVSGVTVGDGNRSQVIAFGPEVGYQIAGVSVIAKWQHEFESENRQQGDKLWLRAVLHF